MDASQGYHQIMLAPKDKRWINFSTSVGTFCYVTMSFGLKNEGFTYQRLPPTTRVECGGIVEDMLIKSNKASDHIKDLEENFEVLWKYKLKSNPTKYTFRDKRGLKPTHSKSKLSWT
ncbi:hypothetical protein Sango_2948600 [Sesamum angolense]|uniref:Reverse transcriptase domain-containing protein n=1 Tax=Sesamum angolense TaxID=2727404 RepID=A0AAE1T540_9LAMI|nr:hypothetical protein Sango_2948600 [Sesamum angolense]